MAKYVYYEGTHIHWLIFKNSPKEIRLNSLDGVTLLNPLHFRNDYKGLKDELLIPDFTGGINFISNGMLLKFSKRINNEYEYIKEHFPIFLTIVRNECMQYRINPNEFSVISIFGKNYTPKHTSTKRLWESKPPRGSKVYFQKHFFFYSS